jgi:hypothetical protein
MYTRLLHILLLIALLLPSIGKGQTYPVQAFVQVSPPYSSYLPDYADPFNNQMKVLLTLTDFSVPSYQVKLRFKIEGSGYTIQNDDLVSLPVITLTPGIPIEVSGSLLAPYLNTANLNFSGIDVARYESSKILPEGPATICVEVVNFSGVNQTLLANVSCAQTWFSLYDPPLVNLPFCGAEVTETDPQAVLFSWTPLHMGSPFAGATEYIFELFEIRPDESDPNLVVNTSLPIYIEATTQTFINYGMLQPPLQVGLGYVWRVKARDPSGRELYRNNGYSAVCNFTYGNIAGSLIGDYTMELQSNGTGVRQGLAWWNATDLFSSYLLEVRKTGNPDFAWFPYPTTDGQLKINSLESETEYECRVKGIAGTAETPWSNTSTFTTQPPLNYACSNTNLPPHMEEIKPLHALLPNNIVAAGQFEMVVVAAEPIGIPGRYRGVGKIYIPFLLSNVNVGFENILIDEDMVLRDGSINVISEGVDAWVDRMETIFIDGIIDDYIFEDDSTVTIYFGDEYREFDLSNGPVTVQDASGLIYTFYPDGTVSISGNITWDDDVLAATKNHQITFHPSDEQTFGFDEKEYMQWTEQYPCIRLPDSSLYFVPYKAIGSNTSDVLLAKVKSKDPILSPRFETKNGQVLATTQLNDTTYEIQSGEHLSGQILYAFDDLGNKIGKVFLPVYARYEHDLIIVPVNGATIAEDVEATINTIFSQANMHFNISIADPYTADFDLDENGLDVSSDGHMTNYSEEMRLLRDRYFDDVTKANRTYYLFVVPDITNDMNGYMVRGKAVGFIESDAPANVYAHELGHGAFALRHTFPTLPKSSSNNLMDYGEYTHLTHHQWEDMHGFDPSFSVFDGEEDGAAYGQPGTHVVIVCDETTLSTINEQRVFYDLAGNKVDLSTLEGTVIANRFYGDLDPTPSAIGALNGFTVNGTQYLTTYLGDDFNGFYAADTEDFTTGGLVIPQSDAPAVRVLTECSLKHFKFDNNDEYHPIDCKECLPKINTQFFTQNSTEILNDFMSNHAENVDADFSTNQEIIDLLVTAVNSELDDNFLDERTKDRLKAYTLYNEDRRFIIAPVSTEYITRNESEWHALAKNVFEQAELGPNDIIITVPYIQCTGIGADQGIIFAMPGLYFGENIEVETAELESIEFNTSLAYAEWQISGPQNIREFINAVFKQTHKFLRIYEGILAPNLTINLNIYENVNSVGYSQNCYIKLYKNDAYTEIAKLVASHAKDVESVKEGGALVGAKYTDWLSRVRRTKKAQVFTTLQHADSKQLSRHKPKDENSFQFKDQYLLAYAEDYIYKRAFKEYFNLLANFEVEFNSPGEFVEPENFTTWNREDYEWQVLDDLVYASVDISSAALGIFGLDFITDGIGFVYASARGDFSNSSVYGMSVLLVGVNAPALKVINKSLFSGSDKLIIRKTAAGYLVENVDEVTHSLRFKHKVHPDLTDEEVFKLQIYINEGKMPSASLKAFEDAQKNLSKQRELLDEAAVFIDEALKASLLVKYVDYPNISKWIDETSNNSVLTKLENLDFDKYASNLDEDLLDLDFKSALNEDAELVGAWESIENTGFNDLASNIFQLRTFNEIVEYNTLNLDAQGLEAILKAKTATKNLPWEHPDKILDAVKRGSDGGIDVISIKGFPEPADGNTSFILSNAKQYQKEASGDALLSFDKNGVSFDNVTLDGKLIDRKYGHSSVFNEDGSVRNQARANSILEQAQRQLNAVNGDGSKLRWEISSEGGANGIERLFLENAEDIPGLDMIKVEHVVQKTIITN